MPSNKWILRHHTTLNCSAHLLTLASTADFDAFFDHEASVYHTQTTSAPKQSGETLHTTDPCTSAAHGLVDCSPSTCSHTLGHPHFRLPSGSSSPVSNDAAAFSFFAEASVFDESYAVFRFSLSNRLRSALMNCIACNSAAPGSSHGPSPTADDHSRHAGCPLKLDELFRSLVELHVRWQPNAVAARHIGIHGFYVTENAICIVADHEVAAAWRSGCNVRVYNGDKRLATKSYVDFFGNVQYVIHNHFMELLKCRPTTTITGSMGSQSQQRRSGDVNHHRHAQQGRDRRSSLDAFSLSDLAAQLAASWSTDKHFDLCHALRIRFASAIALWWTPSGDRVQPGHVLPRLDVWVRGHPTADACFPHTAIALHLGRPAGQRLHGTTRQQLTNDALAGNGGRVTFDDLFTTSIGEHYFYVSTVVDDNYASFLPTLTASVAPFLVEHFSDQPARVAAVASTTSTTSTTSTGCSPRVAITTPTSTATTPRGPLVSAPAGDTTATTSLNNACHTSTSPSKSPSPEGRRTSSISTGTVRSSSDQTSLGYHSGDEHDDPSLHSTAACQHTTPHRGGCRFSSSPDAPMSDTEMESGDLSIICEARGPTGWSPVGSGPAPVYSLKQDVGADEDCDEVAKILHETFIASETATDSSCRVEMKAPSVAVRRDTSPENGNHRRRTVTFSDDVVSPGGPRNKCVPIMRSEKHNQSSDLEATDLKTGTNVQRGGRGRVLLPPSHKTMPPDASKWTKHSKATNMDPPNQPTQYHHAHLRTGRKAGGAVLRVRRSYIAAYCDFPMTPKSRKSLHNKALHPSYSRYSKLQRDQRDCNSKSEGGPCRDASVSAYQQPRLVSTPPPTITPRNTNSVDVHPNKGW